MKYRPGLRSSSCTPLFACPVGTAINSGGNGSPNLLITINAFFGGT
jgi:hypothetical protein